MSARDCCIKGVEPTEKCVAVSTETSGRSDEPSKPFDIRELSPAALQSCCGPVFAHYVPFHPFWNNNVYSVPLYVGSM